MFWHIVVCRYIMCEVYFKFEYIVELQLVEYVIFKMSVSPSNIF